jgi:hypothetical protein
MNSEESGVKGELTKPEEESTLERALEDVPGFAEVIKELPPEQQKTVSGLFAQFSPGSMSSPIAKQINSEHISQLIANDERDSERAFKMSSIAETTKRLSIAAVLTLVTLVLLYAGITKDKELSEKVMTAAIGGLGGFGIGLAVGKQKEND